ncbi:MAG: hypothetical protein QG616_1660 [Pseudomonadota bacterium]|nr:hypothetical protein [Pseudomonadota bacterium]MDQ5881829.1 hypothetical protein [Pseudomonadota bacterium]MDQ5903160.1 hypothetical protein [Pseudomonadota bacterium]MDQ5907871.1 hypothetical protein [Pseudomonadota bacterium]MDQ5917315.1 hypothetical protein [Pseudomonadota bacterium]
MRIGNFDSIRVAREENLDRSRHSLHSANGRIRLYLVLRKPTGCTSAEADVAQRWSAWQLSTHCRQSAILVFNGRYLSRAAARLAQSRATGRPFLPLTPLKTSDRSPIQSCRLPGTSALPSVTSACQHPLSKRVPPTPPDSPRKQARRAEQRCRVRRGRLCRHNGSSPHCPE